MNNKFSTGVFIGLASFFLIGAFSYAQEVPLEGESDQQISEFSLSGYGEKGKKAWDLTGKSADIFDEVVKLKSIIGNLYGKQEDIKLTADKGDFNKVNGFVHLENNVIITTSSGAKLTTEVLDWDRKVGRVSTKEMVNITRENMFTSAQGAVAEPDLNKVTLEKQVMVKIDSVSEKSKEYKPGEKTIITSDGPLEIDYQKNIAIFKNNVKVDRLDITIYSDEMDVYFAVKSGSEKKAEPAAQAVMPAMMGSKIDKIVCRGNVRIVKGDNNSYSQEAVYSALDKKITLTGQPRLVIYSTEELGASLGDKGAF